MRREILVPVRFAPESLEHFDFELREAQADPGVRVIVLAGGPESFSLGLDLDHLLSHPDSSLPDQVRRTLHRLLDCGNPLIAKVAGKAVGGGLLWAAVADLVVCSEDATFSLPETSFGLPPWVVMACLHNRLTPQKLRLLALSSQAVGAGLAREIGLVDEVVSAEALDSRCDDWARKLGRPSRPVAAMVKAFAVAPGTPKQRLDAACARLAESLNDPVTRAEVESYASALSLFA